MCRTVFFANRSDGLGERLRAVINAIAMSKTFGGEFKFTWKDNHVGSKFHVTETAENIYSSQFLEKHLIKDSEKLEYKIVDEFFLDNSCDYYLCNQQIPHVSSVIKNSVDLSSYNKELKDAFWDIEFSTSIENVIHHAKHVEIVKPAIAVHLRAGDIVYGKYKDLIAHSRKAIPYAVADKIIEKAKIEGFEVIIFGQDSALIDFLSKKWIAKVASYLAPDRLSSTEAAVFDIVLMSRCEKIYAGTSGFSMLSSIIGGSELIYYDNSLKESEIAQAVLNRISVDINNMSVPAEQISHSCKVALYKGFNTLEDDVFDLLASFGKKATPEFLIFDFMMIFRALGNGDISAAQEIANYLMHERGESLISFLKLNCGHPTHLSPFIRFFNFNLLKNYDSNSPLGEFYSALKRISNKL